MPPDKSRFEGRFRREHEPDEVVKILVIDDNPHILEDFRAVLVGREDQGDCLRLEQEILGGGQGAPMVRYQLDTAAQGKHGVELVRRSLAEGKHYSLAFVDIRMPPGWDGLTTTERIWELDPAVQVVLCSAYSDHSWDEVHQRLGESGNLFILKKPFDPLEVRQFASSLSLKRLQADELREFRLRAGRLVLVIDQQGRVSPLDAATREVLGEGGSADEIFDSRPTPGRIDKLTVTREDGSTLHRAGEFHQVGSHLLGILEERSLPLP